ncbi:hypothetical protein [Taklimakanibacter lacteus]|uniref:hypothetical protein n=1 Tax=Taklimakanibacter lacteus TaxID=2268456 RepID=UPI0013C4AFB6
MSDFGKYWKDLKKHKKRNEHWLPHIKGLAKKLNGTRSLRYFTLCARPMIDVFMLVKEGVLLLDTESHAIDSVQFCELDPEHFVEIRDLVAREDAGFQDRLEPAVLFEDDSFTMEFPSLDSISEKLEDEGFLREEDKVDRLQLKRTHFRIKESFPYDFINLDFCDHYYPEPPDIMRINNTVERFLKWQNQTSSDGSSVEEFVLAVTCRHDEKFPQAAKARLINLIKENCKSDAYKSEIEKTRKLTKIDDWANVDLQDFFFSGWPKDIAGAARENGWAIEILDYVYYSRLGDSGTPYIMACLVARFTRNNPVGKYLTAAFHALEKNKRILIPEINPDSADGKTLISNLKAIVAVRNAQAERVHRPGLPDP